MYSLVTVAKDCHKGDTANADRDGVVQKIRTAGFRVEGLAKCMRTNNPEGVVLANNFNTGTRPFILRLVFCLFFFLPHCP